MRFTLREEVIVPQRIKVQRRCYNCYDRCKERQSPNKKGVWPNHKAALHIFLFFFFHRLSFSWCLCPSPRVDRGNVCTNSGTSTPGLQWLPHTLVEPSYRPYLRTNTQTNRPDNDNCERRIQTSTPGKFPSDPPQSMEEERLYINLIYVLLHLRFVVGRLTSEFDRQKYSATTLMIH